MEFRGNKVYLTPSEQRDSCFESPIVIGEFELHEEREKADAKLDELEEMVQFTDDDAYGRGAFISEYKRAKSRSDITRGIAKELSKRVLVLTGLEDIEQFMSEQSN